MTDLPPTPTANDTAVYVCDCCSQVQDEPLELMIDPYAQDVYGEETELYICDSCYEERVADI